MFFAGHGASGTRDVEVSMTCTTLWNRNEGQGRSGGYTALGRRTHTTIRTLPTHATSTNSFQRPTTLYMYKRRLATSTRRNTERRSRGSVVGEECHVHSTIWWSFSAQAQGRRHVTRTYRLTGRINNLNFSAQVAVYVQPCS